MLSRIRDRWIGVALTLVASVATVWLWASGHLGLYVHPRYFVFTLLFALLGLVLVIASFLVRLPPEEPGGGDPGGGDPRSSGTRRGRRVRLRRRALSGWRPTVAAVAMAACLFGAFAIIVVPPATLSSATVAQRSVNSGSVLGGTGATVQKSDDTSGYGVKEWATALRQSTDLAGVSGKSADLVGFVSADQDDPDNVFYVTRFFVTCCAADAQPLGVPVYLPNWADTVKTDQWVQVTGSFALNPSVQSRQPMVIVPQDVVGVDEPKDPYVY